MVTVWISQDVDNRPEQLDRRKDKEFQVVMVEAVRRFLTAIKRTHRMWHLDHRQAVRLSNPPCYDCEDAGVKTELPVQSFAPQGLDVFKLSADDLGDEVTETSWKRIQEAFEQSAQVAYYEEVIWDARVFRGNRRCATAVLYAAFAAESVLEEMAAGLLAKNGQRLKNMKVPLLIKLVEALLGTKLPRFNGQRINKLFELRNEIAHKQKTTASLAEATGAIKVAEELRNLLNQRLP